MSASREKKFRQQQSASGDQGPKSHRAQEQEKARRRSDRLYNLGIGAFVLLAAITLLWSSNVIPRSVAAVTIDGQDYSAAEVMYYYQNALGGFSNNFGYFTSFLGVDLSKSLKDQTVGESAINMLGAREGITWHEYFLDSAIEEMTRIQRGLERAEQEGFQFPQSVEDDYKDALQNLKTNAALSGVSVNGLLQRNLGDAMTEKVYTRQLLRQLQYESYRDAQKDSLTYTQEQIDRHYADNANTYDTVSWEYVSISRLADTTAEDGSSVTPTDEQNAEADAAAKATAEKILADYQGGTGLKEAAEKEDKASYYENPATTYSSGETSEWLFDPARKEGDIQVLEMETTYYVALFHSRSRDESNTVNVRHLLVMPDSGTKGEEDEGYAEEQTALKAAARTKAEEWLAQWKAGEATEASFAALAKEHSADQGSKNDGGLIADISSETSLVEEFKDWCLDESRRSGDTGVVESTYGAHVMYFVGTGAPVWEYNVVEDLKAEDMTEWVEALVKDADAQHRSFGMKFVA